MSKSKTAVHKITKLHPANINFTAIMEGPIFFPPVFMRIDVNVCVLYFVHTSGTLLIQLGEKYPKNQKHARWLTLARHLVSV